MFYTFAPYLLMSFHSMRFLAISMPFYSIPFHCYYLRCDTLWKDLKLFHIFYIYGKWKRYKSGMIVRSEAWVNFPLDSIESDYDLTFRSLLSEPKASTEANDQTIWKTFENSKTKSEFGKCKMQKWKIVSHCCWAVKTTPAQTHLPPKHIHTQSETHTDTHTSPHNKMHSDIIIF